VQAWTANTTPQTDKTRAPHLYKTLKLVLACFRLRSRVKKVEIPLKTVREAVRLALEMKQR
jgi:hypothetical protein